MPELNGWLLLLLLIAADFVLGGEYCLHYREGIRYCENGCCGRTLYEYCCVFAVWMIVLLVLGAFILIGVVVFFVFYFYCKKRGRTNGRVVYPGDIPHTQTVSTVHTVQYPGSVYPTAPPPYSAVMYPYVNPTAPPPYQQHYQQQQQQQHNYQHQQQSHQQQHYAQSGGTGNNHISPAVYDPDSLYRNRTSRQTASNNNPANSSTGPHSAT